MTDCEDYLLIGTTEFLCLFLIKSLIETKLTWAIQSTKRYTYCCAANSKQTAALDTSPCWLQLWLIPGQGKLIYIAKSHWTSNRSNANVFLRFPSHTYARSSSLLETLSFHRFLFESTKNSLTVFISKKKKAGKFCCSGLTATFCILALYQAAWQLSLPSILPEWWSKDLEYKGTKNYNYRYL